MKMPFTRQFKFSDRGKLKLQRCKNIYHTNINLKNIGTTVLIPEKVSDQIRSLAPSCPTLCDLMTRSTPGLPVHHQLPEFTQTHVHRVSDAIQPSHPL